MQKVFGSIKFFIAICFFVFNFLYLWVRAHGFDSLFYDWGVTVFIVFLLAVSFFYSISSSWAYGEKGIEVFGLSGKVLKTYKWTEVSSIVRWSSIKMAFVWAVLEMKDGQQVVIWYFMTRNYYRVLSDVVRCVQNENPEAFIDSWVLKQVEKGL